jgi:hypothetical protein
MGRGIHPGLAMLASQMDLILRFIVGVSGVAWDEPVRSGR